MLGLAELAGRLERIVLKEKPDLVARAYEVVVIQLGLLGGRENAARSRWIEGIDQLGGAISRFVIVIPPLE